MLKVLCFAALVCLSEAALPANPLDDLKEEALLQRAIEDIDKMPKGELDGLAVVLSACAPLKPLDEGMPRYYCNKELVSYQAKDSKGRALDILLRTLYRSSRLLILNIPAVTSREDYEALIQRHASVMETLVTASFLRSRDLAVRGKPSKG